MKTEQFGSRTTVQAGAGGASKFSLVRLSLLGLLLLGMGSRFAGAAGTPAYHLLKKMNAGGEGGWDYLNVDAQARRIYISRGDHVDVVDADTGSKVGAVSNTPGVHGIALAPRLGRG